MIREYKPSDLEELKRIHSKDHPFKFPDVDSPLSIVKLICEVEGKVLAFGMVKLAGEVTFLADTSKSLVSRVQALDGIMKVGIAQSFNKGVDELHAFMKNEDLAHTLEKSFGYQRFSGSVLFREIGNG